MRCFTGAQPPAGRAYDRRTRPASGNQAIVELLQCFRSVAAQEHLGNLVVTTIWGSVRCSFTTNCHQPIAATVPRDRS